MHAYLMGAPCEQLAVDERVAVVAPPSKRSSTRNVVMASRADGVSRTAMRVRSFSARAMGASIIPVSWAITPCTSAR